QYFCSNFTFFFALTWLFPYLKETYQLGALEAGWYTSAPFIAGALGNWVSGGMIDVLYRKGDWDLSRKLPAIIGFSLAAIGLIASLFAGSALVAVACLSVAIFGADMTLPPSWSLCVDIGRRNAGAVSGTMNMAGNLGSFLTALAFPYLTDWTGSEQVFFYVAAALNVIAIGLWWRVQASRGMAY
ncbi:MAG: MFS transporter, partial [Bacteroidota bacterium]